MYNKEMIIDFINYGIISSVFLIVPFSKELFIINIFWLIMDFIMLYIVEREER